MGIHLQVLGLWNLGALAKIFPEEKDRPDSLLALPHGRNTWNYLGLQCWCNCTNCIDDIRLPKSCVRLSMMP